MSFSVKIIVKADFCRTINLKKEASEKQKTQQKCYCVNNDFDKTHKISYFKNESLKWLRIKKHFSSAFVPMSTTNEKFSLLPVILVEILLFIFAVSAQEIEANIKIKSSSPVVNVEGKFLKENFLQADKNWSFVNSLAGADNLGVRISNLNLKDKRAARLFSKSSTTASICPKRKQTPGVIR